MRRWSKNQHFWPTIKPFFNSRHDTNIDITLCENDSIISESETVAKILNKYFNEIADGIGFNGPIPENFDKDDILLSMIKRYDDHPSIVTIKKKFCPQGQTFHFVHITANDVKSCIIIRNSKKSTGYDGFPVKLLKVGADPLSMIISELINMSIAECTFPDLLKSSDTIKVLGIDIDDRVTFDGHISNMCIKAGRQLNALQRLKGSLDQDSRMAIYKSFIMFNFNYCPLIWMFTSKTSLSKLENIQKRAFRFVLDDLSIGLY